MKSEENIRLDTTDGLKNCKQEWRCSAHHFYIFHLRLLVKRIASVGSTQLGPSFDDEGRFNA